MNYQGEPVYVGRDYGGRELELSAELCGAYRDALEANDSLYADYVPGLLLHSECFEDLSWYLANLYGNLHARQQWEMYRAVAPGTRACIASTQRWTWRWKWAAASKPASPRR